MAELYGIGPFVLDAQTGVLTQAGSPVSLGKRAVAVLAVLVRSAHEYVPKTRILEEAWPGLVVQESNLAVQILSIRRALATASGGDAWVETLPRRGYRFVGPVTRLPDKVASDVDVDAHSNLPEPLTSFVGRARERAEIEQLLAANRLVTLTGTGGVGKTRLALCVAAGLTHAYREGVWLVELASLADPALVPQAVATALELQEQPGRSLTQTLVEYLQPRELLLVLDNAEHLLAACTHLTDAVLRQCARVKWLVTSRERLDVPGEVTYRVPSLSMPDSGRDTPVQALLEYESVRLFRERAWLHRPHFAVTAQNAPAMASICRRLDGIPLAIELAAARARAMSIEELNERLDRRLALLTGGSRTLPRRQQTLRAAIDWSFDLLSDSEQALFRRLSVFAGGWTLDAAEHVCVGEGIESRDVLDRLASLADKSLVQVEERPSSTRYRFLETVHQYAIERLRESGDETPWSERHLAHFLTLAVEAERKLTGKDQQAALDRLESEHDNVRAALARACLDGGNAQAGLRLATAISRFWLVRGYLTEGRTWLSRLLAAAGSGEKATRAKALNWAGALAWKQGDYSAARALYEQSLALHRELRDRGGAGAVLSNLGLLAYEQGDYANARALHEESLAIDRESGDRWGVAVSLIHLGSIASAQGDPGAARRLYEESLALFREVGDRGHIANALRSLAALCTREGDDAAAQALYDESLAICRELRDRAGIARASYGLGVTARHRGDHATALAMQEEALAAFRDLGDREAIANALHELGELAAARRDHEEARALHAESLGIYRALHERSGIAASVESLAGIASAAGQWDLAARMWGAMERLREEIGAPLAASERAGHDRCIADARTALADDAAFDAAWREGRAMTDEEAIACALDDRAANARAAPPAVE